VDILKSAVLRAVSTSSDGLLEIYGDEEITEAANLKAFEHSMLQLQPVEVVLWAVALYDQNSCQVMICRSKHGRIEYRN
jgi:hypothetical protein